MPITYPKEIILDLLEPVKHVLNNPKYVIFSSEACHLFHHNFELEVKYQKYVQAWDNKYFTNNILLL